MFNKATKDLFILGTSGKGSSGMQHALGLSSSILNDNRNENPFLKAWGVLFHFRNKSLHSPLYDEVENIQARQYSNEFYDKILEVVLERDYYFRFFPICKNSGWKLDMMISRSKSKNEKIGIMFLQKEDVVYNIEKGRDEPIGLKKLMLTQLKSVSDMHIVPIYESQIYKNQGNYMNQFDLIDRIISEQFSKLQSK